MSQKELVAFCGINCLECPTFIATQTDDNELRKKTANEWSSPESPLKTEEINCEGCTTKNKQLFTFCRSCQVRMCGTEKNVQNCAYCDEYVCDKLENLWQVFSTFSVTEIRKKFDLINQQLSSSTR